MNLKKILNDNVDSYDPSGLTSSTSVGSSPINPKFTAQFDISVSLNYYRGTATQVTSQTSIGVMTDMGDNGNGVLDHMHNVDNHTHGVSSQYNVGFSSLNPDELPIELKNDVAVYLFGKSDASSGYAHNRNLFPTTNWAFKEAINVDNLNKVIDFRAGAGRDYYKFSDYSPSVIDGKARLGDHIQSYTYFSSVTPEQIVFYYCEVVVSCKNVSYAALLDASASDRFILNHIRYKIQDSSKVDQFENQIKYARKSLFGLNIDDAISPISFEDQKAQKDNILDIPIKQGIDKESSIGTYLKYDVGEIIWATFVLAQSKITTKK